MFLERIVSKNYKGLCDICQLYIDGCHAQRETARRAGYTLRLTRATLVDAAVKLVRNYGAATTGSPALRQASMVGA